tara:strand:+ start:1994 stop:2104 length:111 start_codon:yes stop_codon:yes gene_type:complete
MVFPPDCFRDNGMLSRHATEESDSDHNEGSMDVSGM